MLTLAAIRLILAKPVNTLTASRRNSAGPKASRCQPDRVNSTQSIGIGSHCQLAGTRPRQPEGQMAVVATAN